MYDPDEKISALLLDDRFVDWVVNPQSHYNEYWRQWMNASAENAWLAGEAKGFLLELQEAAGATEKEIGDAGTAHLWSQIRQGIGDEKIRIVRKKAPAPSRWYWAAAAFAVSLLAALLYIPVFRSSSARVAQVKVNKPSNTLVRYNSSGKNELIFLSDGSRVVLARGASISWQRLMNGNKREVTLTGEAFFEVAKNAGKPFYIYTKNLVVRVLGTSFRVVSSDTIESVIVKTGKVKVYLNGRTEQSTARTLLPRQGCTYSGPQKKWLTASCSDDAGIELETDQLTEYNFEDAPVDAVFKALEKMYSIPVHYDRQVFASCYVTISLGNESLEEKLKVITGTVDASFSIGDDGIHIEGKGCQ